MELDELKQSWTKSNEKIKIPDRDILEMIRNNSDGPVAKLKRRFKKGMFILPAIALIAGTKLVQKHGFIFDVFTLYFFTFCFLITIYFYLNYRLVSQIQAVDGDVKTNLKRQVRLLQAGLKWRLLITRGMMVLFIIVLELLMQLKQDNGFEKWHTQPVVIRLLIYAGAFLFFYLLTKFATNLRYNKYIRHLEVLTEQLL
ncbi:MAG: hypothetical protein M3Y85_01780 [Bacteroidota bacterium]|nr:hypothetical protein [Bacteroidota bacterium]